MKQSDVEEDRAFQLLLYKIKQVKGLDFSQYRPSCFKRRIDTRLRVHNLKDYKEYLLFLNRNPSEFDELLNAATINVSEFFRDKEAWDFVLDTLLPALINKKIERNQRIIRIWSAGSSRGEEAYTVAILFHEILGTNLDQFNIRIIGTDIDNACLKEAQLGCYTPASVKNIASDRLSRYFKFDGQHYQIKENLQILTTFEHHDLVLAEPLKHIDLVICRNVLIYFSKELQAKIMEKFNHALNPNGLLMLGKTESYGSHMEEYFKFYHSSERIYQKR